MPPNLKAGDFLTRAFKHHACGTRAIRALCPRSRGHENAPVGISTGRRRGAHGRRALRRRCRGCQPGSRGPNGRERPRPLPEWLRPRIAVLDRRRSPGAAETTQAHRAPAEGWSIRPSRRVRGSPEVSCAGPPRAIISPWILPRRRAARLPGPAPGQSPSAT